MDKGDSPLEAAGLAEPDPGAPPWEVVRLVVSCTVNRGYRIPENEIGRSPLCRGLAGSS
jgi:hypothetical protein